MSCNCWKKRSHVRKHARNPLKGEKSPCKLLVLRITTAPINHFTCRQFHLARHSSNVFIIFMTYFIFYCVVRMEQIRNEIEHTNWFLITYAQFDLREYVPAFAWNALYNKENQFDQWCSSMRTHFFSLSIYFIHKNWIESIFIFRMCYQSDQISHIYILIFHHDASNHGPKST